MKTAAEYLDAIKSRNGIPSDYALAKNLGVTRAQVSHYRVGRDHFSAEICERIAALLDTPIEDVLLDSAICRAKTDSERRAWQRVIQRLGGTAAAVAAVAILAGSPAPAQADTGDFMQKESTVCLLCKVVNYPHHASTAGQSAAH